MNVVIAGARSRSEQQDMKLIHTLLEALQQKYPKLMVITTACDRGIGKLVKNRCMPEELGGKPRINFAEISSRIYVDDMSSTDFAVIFNAKNRALVAAGEEFHLFMGHNEKGVMYDLYQEVVEKGLPCAKYMPDEKTGPKEPQIEHMAGNPLGKESFTN